jgi:hypothetical protein
VGEMVKEVNMVQTLCTYVCKWKNDIWGGRRMVKGVNSSKKYMIHCKNFCHATIYPHPVQQ